MPKLEQWEIKKYWQIFCGLHPENNKLTQQQLEPVFKNSRLSQDDLDQIWSLADIEDDGELDFEEFCIAMRLTFDRVNGNITKVPETLPPWLIPGDKKQLVEAKQGSAEAQLDSGDSEDEDYRLSDDFDWYISPTDKSSYESVYDSACDRYGRVAFDSLDDLYKTLSGVPQTDVSSAWNLVNPKQSVTIDHDQCMVYLHILNQRSHGKRVPRSVPASLRATFSKQEPSYDPSSSQGDVAVLKSSASSAGGSSSGSSAPGSASAPANGFGSSYLAKKGQTANTQGADGDLEGADAGEWEEVKLKRELQQLTDQLAKAQEAKKNKGNEDLQVTKYEYEQLLKYKQNQVADLGRTSDLDTARENIAEVEAQVAQLQSFLDAENKEALDLKVQIERLHY